MSDRESLPKYGEGDDRGAKEILSDLCLTSSRLKEDLFLAKAALTDEFGEQGADLAMDLIISIEDFLLCAKFDIPSSGDDSL